MAMNHLGIPSQEAGLQGNRRDAAAARRATGQVWTPAWVAEAMAAYVLADQASTVFDPAAGSGALLHAAQRIGAGRTLRLIGMETDPAVVKTAGVRLGDFLRDPPRMTFPAIMLNPPYLRYQRMTAEAKQALRDAAMTVLGVTLDGRAGLHFAFLIQSLALLDAGGSTRRISGSWT